MNNHTNTPQGIAYASVAFTFWGLTPIYYKLISNVSSTEVLAHRVVWSVGFLLLLLLFSKQYAKTLDFIKIRSNLKYLAITSVLISINWLVYIYAIATDRILEASLGYFINPLVNLFLAFFFLKERLNKNQYLAVAIAFLAVLYQLILLGEVPLISLTLAFSFGFYGLLRKKTPVTSMPGLFIETLLITPFALAFLVYLYSNNTLSFGNIAPQESFYLALSGIVTVLPLIWFNAATKRLSLSTLGFLQYIGPTIAFLLAVYVYNEPLDSNKLITFILIWIALIIFSLNGIKQWIKS